MLRNLLLSAAWLVAASCPAAEHAFYVSPTGSDDAAGTRAAPFRTLARAQAAARATAQDMKADVVVNLAPGDYRIERTFELTDADSGRNGFRVIYRSEAGPGKARLLGSRPLVGWQPHRGPVWKIPVPKGLVFHTLYENGRRVWKARFPNYEHHADLPCALGPYLVSAGGTPKRTDREADKPREPGWLEYEPDVALPVVKPSTMKIQIFTGGKCDWMREIHRVTAIDPKTRRLDFSARALAFGVGVGARFFLEDELGLLDTAGEFYLDQAASMLYYIPMGEGHPDRLGICAPLVARLVQIQGASRDPCARNITLDGLALAETDDAPPTGWWSTRFGLDDGALVWMKNAEHVEVRNCHLQNGGRSGVMLIGHNVGNTVTGCWIERMGVNGVTLSNRFRAADGKGPTADRCERNRIHNNRIEQVGQLHTYAACVNVFNASHNEVSHCELVDSVRYAVTVRGNTGEQYGPPVWVDLPPAKGNLFHHLRIARCGQDGGDMGALHAANLNNPGGGCVNTFEQITVADTRAIASMKDIEPNGIFLDWPKMAMDQVFRNVEIVRSQGLPIRSNRPENADSAQTANVSWKPGFREELMDYETIGLTSEFPAAYGGRPPVARPLAPPRHVRAKATSYDTVVVEWDASPIPAGEQATYTVLRDGVRLASTSKLRFVDRFLAEQTAHGYRVAARSGDFRRQGEPSPECPVRTPADATPPAVTGARSLPDGRRVRVAFSEPVEPEAALHGANYRFEPRLDVAGVKPLGPACVELDVKGFQPGTRYELAVAGVTDCAAARNPIDGARRVTLDDFQRVVAYPMDRPAKDRLGDASGGGGDALLRGGATIEPLAGPRGGAALVLDGTSGFAEAPADLNLGPGDFTIMAWIYRESHGVILSKGNGFGSAHQWSWGWGKDGVPRCISLRVRNDFFATAANSIPDRQWVHAAMVKQGNQGISYVDGQPSGGPHDLSGIGPLVNDRALRVGRREFEPNPTFFKGKIAGIAVFNRALSPAEIRAEAERLAGADH